MTDDTRNDDTRNPNDSLPAAQPEQPPAPTLGRRLFVFKAAAVLGAAAVATTGVAVVTATPAQAQRCTDRDPNDARGRGSDSDPRDRYGRGRWCQRRRVRRVTDNDPRDARGRGRGW